MLSRFHARFDWNDVKLFLQIARMGTSTAAATALGLSQPTASRRLKALEMAIGDPLFQRDGNTYILTKEGELMLAHAERMEEEALALGRRLVTGGIAGESLVKITGNDWFCHRVLANVIAGFVIANPSIAVEMVADPRFMDLRRREADLAIQFTPFADASVIQRRIAEIRYGLYASPEYLAEYGHPDESDAGDGHRLILLDSALDEKADVSWLRQCWPKARLAFRSNNRESQARACRQSVGLAVLPRLIGDELPLQLLDQESPPGRTVYLGYHSDLRGQRRLRLLIDHLTSSIPRLI